MIVDVALWLRWPSPMPEYVEWMQASNAFAAIEGLMRLHDLTAVAYASARALDGSLIYRGYGIDVLRQRAATMLSVAEEER